MSCGIPAAPLDGLRAEAFQPDSWFHSASRNGHWAMLHPCAENRDRANACATMAPAPNPPPPPPNNPAILPATPPINPAMPPNPPTRPRRSPVISALPAGSSSLASSDTGPLCALIHDAMPEMNDVTLPQMNLSPFQNPWMTSLPACSSQVPALANMLLILPGRPPRRFSTSLIPRLARAIVLFQMVSHADDISCRTLSNMEEVLCRQILNSTEISCAPRLVRAPVLFQRRSQARATPCRTSSAIWTIRSPRPDQEFSQVCCCPLDGGPNDCHQVWLPWPGLF